MKAVLQCGASTDKQWLDEQRRRGRQVRFCVGCSHEHADGGGDHTDETGYWCFSCWGHESNRRNGLLWIGKTVASVEIYDASPDQDWTDHERLLIRFTDGSQVEVGAWGHDAWGVAGIEEPEWPN